MFDHMPFHYCRMDSRGLSTDDIEHLYLNMIRLERMVDRCIESNTGDSNGTDGPFNPSALTSDVHLQANTVASSSVNIRSRSTWKSSQRKHGRFGKVSLSLHIRVSHRKRSSNNWRSPIWMRARSREKWLNIHILLKEWKRALSGKIGTHYIDTWKTFEIFTAISELTNPIANIHVIQQIQISIY